MKKEHESHGEDKKVMDKLGRDEGTWHKIKSRFFGLVHGMLKCQSYSALQYVIIESICCVQLLRYPFHPIVEERLYIE